jgi:hypothetical protein
MDYILKLGKSFGNIKFEMSEEEVKAKLGEPDEVNEEETKDTQGNIRIKDFQYDDLELLVSFTYFEDEYDSLNVFTGKAILDGVDLYSKNKQEILDILSELSELSTEDAKVTDLEADDDEEYDYEDLGITIWFDEEGELNDISVGIADEDFDPEFQLN